jgi:hypothetical protein
MVAHWRKIGGNGKSQWINGLGAVATGVTLVVVVISKLGEGAWLTVVVIPLLVLLFGRINRHYRLVGAAVAETAPLDLSATQKPIAIVPVQSWNRLTSRGLRFALSLSNDVRALHILPESNLCGLQSQWDALVVEPSRRVGLAAPTLVLRKSTYRQFFAPLIEYVERVRDENPHSEIIVIVPDLVVRHWYQALLHNNRGIILKGLLRLRGGPRVVVVNTPFYLAQ